MREEEEEGEEGRPTDRKQRVDFKREKLRSVTNGKFQLFTGRSSALGARSRLCSAAGESAINEGIKQEPGRASLPERGIPWDWFC